jgi:uncharacterized protein (DUF4415 family)
MRKTTKTDHESGEYRIPPTARRVPKEQRHEVPSAALADPDRFTKVRISICLDLDVLNYFKTRAAGDGTPYQTQINAELRRRMDEETSGGPKSDLRMAKDLIDQAMRRIR